MPRFLFFSPPLLIGIIIIIIGPWFHFCDFFSILQFILLRINRLKSSRLQNKMKLLQHYSQHGDVCVCIHCCDNFLFFLFYKLDPLCDQSKDKRITSVEWIHREERTFIFVLRTQKKNGFMYQYTDVLALPAYLHVYLPLLVWGAIHALPPVMKVSLEKFTFKRILCIWKKLIRRDKNLIFLVLHANILLQINMKICFRCIQNLSLV